MAALFLCLLVLAHWWQFVSGSLLSYSKACGADQVEYLESPDGGYYLSINGRSIEDPYLMCAVLDSHFKNGCSMCDSNVEAWERIEKYCCSQDFRGSSHGKCRTTCAKHVGRKLLRNLPTNASRLDQRSKRGQSGEEKQENFFSSEQQDVPLAFPGMILLCCGFLCPCFQAKKGEAMDENDQSRQLSSMDSALSLDVSTGLEKISATPRVPPSPSRFSLSPQLSRIGSVNLTLNQIIKATQNFSPSLKLGEGGFGTVYKGFLPDGQVIALKRAKKEILSTLRDEFSYEVELLAKIEHRNLVQLLGFYETGNERIMITEYVSNGTLRDHLDGRFGKILDFNQRLEIAIDVAHGLTYLHLYAEKTIIHRDVKSSNILLTESYRAKVSDFGFARSGPTDTNQTHISTKVKGTAGYLDPEYLRSYQLTPKSDVFSFGILLLEIISGRRPVELRRAADERITVRWVFKKYNEGNLTDILDPLLGEKIDDNVIGKLLNLAFHCAAPTRPDRPDMKEVGEQLWEIRNEYGKSVKRTVGAKKLQLGMEK